MFLKSKMYSPVTNYRGAFNSRSGWVKFAKIHKSGEGAGLGQTHKNQA